MPRGKPPAGWTDLAVQFFLETDDSEASHWSDAARSFAPQIVVYDTMLPKSRVDQRITARCKNTLSRRLRYALARTLHETTILMVSGARQCTLFDIPKCVDFVTIPALKKTLNGGYKNGLGMKSTSSSLMPASNDTTSFSTIRVAIYARVLSDQQAQEQTIESQLAALRERITKDGHALDDKFV